MNFDTFYVTRYMGAKYKLLNLLIPPIRNALDVSGTFVDLMGGTHAVGYALKRNYKIVSNDVQYYSQIFGRAIIENSEVLELRNRFSVDFEDVEFLDQENNWFTRTYRDTYFSEYQCVEIAAIRNRIETIDSIYARDLYLTALANAMSLCQSSSGHFAQYFPATHPRLKKLREMSIFAEFSKRVNSLDVVKGNMENRVFNLEALELLNSKDFKNAVPDGSVVYLDPPYTSAQYSRYYHLLETVFLNDKPQVDFKGLYRPGRYQSAFCSPKHVSNAFSEIIESCHKSNLQLFISYSNFGLLTPEDLLALCRKHFNKVELKQQDYAHSMQGRGQVKNRNEILICCIL